MTAIEFVDAGATMVLQSSDGNDPTDTFIILSVLFLGGLYAIYWGFGQWKLSRLIEDTPTENVRSMAAGRTELEGVVREHEGTIDPPYVTDPCVYVDWEAQRRERYRDDDGNVKHRWETVASGTKANPFALEDDTGRAFIRLDRDDPTVDINDDTHRVRDTYHKGEQPPGDVTQFMAGSKQTEGNDTEDDAGFLDEAIDTVGDAVSGGRPLSDTGHRRRYTQQVLPIGSNVYFLGGAQPRSDASMSAGQQDLLELGRHDGTDVFLVSDSDEEDLQESYSRRGPAAMVAGLVVSAVSLYYLLSWFILA